MKPLLLFLLTLSLLACEKSSNAPEQPGTFIFYKTGAPLANWHIVINDIDRGIIPYTPTAPKCNDNTGLRLQMAPGTYRLKFKSMDGYATPQERSITLTSGQCLPYPL